MRLKTIHPFPARMAPELALAPIRRLKKKGTILDPMTGSGTVVRCASRMGHTAIGVDSDPLAVLMSRVWTTRLDEKLLARLSSSVCSLADEYFDSEKAVPWIDSDPEMVDFVDFWFGEHQQKQLRALSLALMDHDRPRIRENTRRHLDILRISLSRIIVTKEMQASLARDTSHSRPHRVARTSDFDVFSGFSRSVQKVQSVLAGEKPTGSVNIERGDARNMREICPNRSVDLVVTSPPYLNAIDYMRGHRLSLIWLGYGLKELRNIRSNNIGAERALENHELREKFGEIVGQMGNVNELSSRQQKMISRYAEDTYRLMSEIARVLTVEGKAVLVVGNSCLNGVFVKNSEAIKAAGKLSGLKLLRNRVRELPTSSRYLPTPGKGNPLSKRMRTENVMSFSLS